MFSSGPFKDFDLVRIPTIGDGSCFFHALCSSFYVKYRQNPSKRKKIVQRFRKELAEILSERCKKNKSKTWYQYISRGQLPDISKYVPELDILNMKKELLSGGPVDNKYNELISEILNKDLYLINLLTKDVYITGDDSDILYKGRDSIVILTMPGHYELIGLKKNNGDITTLFSPNHSFIRRIRKRINEKIKGQAE